MHLFDTIEFIIPTMHGWCSVEKARTLAAITLALRPTVACEIGIWGGRSILPVALAMKHLEHGKLIAIDPYSAEASSKDMTGANLEWWAKQDHDAMCRYFLQRLEEHEIIEQVKFMRLPSDAVIPPEKIDLLHCDGNHSDQAVRDIKRFASKVRLGGIAVLDDVHWDGDGVQHAIQAITELGFVELYRVIKKPTDDWAVFERISE